MGKTGSRSLDIPSFVLRAHIKNHSRFPVYLLHSGGVKVLCIKKLLQKWNYNARNGPGKNVLIAQGHVRSFSFLLWKPSLMKQQHIFPGVTGHAFPISVTLDRMYASRGNIQKAESTTR